ncbi:MAG: helix-turn-helix transcriptional regulator [Deltaproteobacteria bacterium]|nr:helix-turn-helix transcriptional regulator [Deltaproteobacteria bacterium]MBI3296100.1 helix-turn-helix transcriptional regulator [Deltaproteobacteria bacterium]
MNALLVLREARKERGLSQVQLAALSGVSLPTIQNIEANKTNPTLEILEKLAAPLGLAIRLESVTPGWDLLAACGVPILSRDKNSGYPSAESLIRQLLLATRELSDEGETRKKEAIQATLLALRDYFPSFFSKYLSRSPLIQKQIPTDLSGRVIRLRRIAIENLSRYL